MGISPFGGFDDFLFRSIFLAISDIGGNGIVKSDHILRDHSNLVPQAVKGDISDIKVVYENPAGIRVIEARQQIGKCSFSRTVRADNSHVCACLYYKVHIAKRRAG